MDPDSVDAMRKLAKSAAGFDDRRPNSDEWLDDVSYFRKLVGSTDNEDEFLAQFCAGYRVACMEHESSRDRRLFSRETMIDSGMRRKATEVLVAHDLSPDAAILEEMEIFGLLGYDKASDSDESKVLAFWCNGFRRGMQEARLQAAGSTMLGSTGQ